jgi:hypothetical protein
LTRGSVWIGRDKPGHDDTRTKEPNMKAEIQAVVDDIRKSLALLRRHL